MKSGCAFLSCSVCASFSVHLIHPFLFVGSSSQDPVMNTSYEALSYADFLFQLLHTSDDGKSILLHSIPLP